jgi:arabinose-5-phosphate isomerase
MERFADLFSRSAADVMTRDPKGIAPSLLATEALRLMEEHQITVLLVHPRAAQRRVAGILHMHDLLRAGVV